jgi:hypothetical protein
MDKYTETDTDTDTGMNMDMDMYMNTKISSDIKIRISDNGKKN